MCKLFCIVSPIPNNVTPVNIVRLVVAPNAKAVAHALTATPPAIPAPAAAAAAPSAFPAPAAATAAAND